MWGKLLLIAGGAAAAEWWEWGLPPFPLQVPSDLAATSLPIWHVRPAQFVFARTEFFVRHHVSSAVAFVTAQQSPFCQPDERLVGNNYGACIPNGGTTQAKLLGAYKLVFNGRVVACGPGRRINNTQGVDAVDVLTSLRTNGRNAVGLQGFHTARFAGDDPRLLLMLVLTYADGSTERISTGPSWRTMNADPVFNPQGSSGAWAGDECTTATCSGMPHEFIDMRVYPTGWDLPSFNDSGWALAAEAPLFVLPLRNKPGRPVAVFARQAKAITAFDGNVTVGGISSACVSCYVIDFGSELQGGVNLTLNAIEAGHVVHVLLSEELRPDGSPLVPMHTGNNFADRWTLRQGRQTVMAHEYAEFRYAMVVNAAEPLKTEDTFAWVIRYPLSDSAADSPGDMPMLDPASSLHRPAALAVFSSDSVALNQVWALVRNTLVACGGLDVNTDSNTRQRDFCATDAFITGVGQLAISSDYGMPAMTAQDGFQLDSNIWRGMTDFRSALISLAYEYALYSGDLSLIQQRYEDIQKHSFVYYFQPSLRLVMKTKAFMGSLECKCPESWSPAGMPPGVFEELQCTCTDLNDWPPQYQDGYIIGNVSTVANAYIALAARRVAEMARWLGKSADAEYYVNVSDSILEALRDRLYNETSGSFHDGLDGDQVDTLAPIPHDSVQATIFPLVAGAVDGSRLPGMGLKVVNYLKGRGMRCSCMAAFFLLEGLYRLGVHTSEAADHALSVLTSDDQYSWLNMIRQGATCTMETWPSGNTPGSGGTGGTWSHPWCAGPNSVLIRFLLGVRPTSPGWARFSFMPQPSSLRSVNATIPMVVAGAVPAEVTVILTQSEGGVFTALTVPQGTRARACLAASYYSTGAPTALRLDGVPVASSPEGRFLCCMNDLGPGSYKLSRV